MNAGLSTKNAPSPSVVLPHYAFGAIAFIIASVMMFFASDMLSASYIGPKVLGLTHILVLSWITVIIFGALYQLIPVVMEVKLYSETLAYISFILIAVGSVLMVYSFWNNYIGNNIIIMIGGTMLVLSIILFAVNTVKSALSSKVKTIENKFIVTSIVWLLLTVLLGFFIILNASYGYLSKSNIELLKIHFQFGIIGWFMMLVIGVASTLMPMFFISHKLKKVYLQNAYYMINIGIVMLSVLLYFYPNIYALLAIGMVIIGGFGFFIKYNYDAYKKRLRRKLDIGMKLSVLAFVLLFFVLILAFLVIFGSEFMPSFTINFNLAFGTLIILGFLTALILGQMYKTLPFIVWLQKYQDKVGKFKIPLPNDLYSEKVADMHYYTYLIAIITLFAGLMLSMSIIIKIASIFFVLTALLFAYNTFKILLHKENLKPLDNNK